MFYLLFILSLQKINSKKALRKWKKHENYNIEQDMRYLQLLSQSFPTIAEASTEIINLQAILNLPKGTEHFLADIHGEYEAFLHVLKMHQEISSVR